MPFYFFRRGNLVQTGFQKSAGNYQINFFNQSGIRKRKYASAWASTVTARKPGQQAFPGGHAASRPRVGRRYDGQSKAADDDHRTDRRPPGDAPALCQHLQIFECCTEDVHQLNLESFSTPAGGASNWSRPATLVLSSSHARSVIIDASFIGTAYHPCRRIT